MSRVIVETRPEVVDLSQAAIETARCPFSGRFNPNRFNILGLIRRFQSEGFNPVAVPITDPRQFKIDTYSFGAIIIPHILKQAIASREQYPPFGLLTPETSWRASTTPLKSFRDVHNPFQRLDESMNYTLLHTLRATILDIRSNPQNYDPILVSVYQSSDRYFAESGDFTDLDSYHFIGRGINTATEVMSKVLEVIPKVYSNEHPGKSGDLNTYMEIAKRSYPLLQFLSREHLKFFSKVSDELRGGWPFSKKERVPFFADRFTVSDQGGLAIKESVVAKVVNRYRDYLEGFVLRGLPAIGCPARYSTSIKDLWAWHLQIAPVVYAAVSTSKRN